MEPKVPTQLSYGNYNVSKLKKKKKIRLTCSPFMKKDAAFLSAMTYLFERLDISTDLLAKCENDLCSIYEPNGTSVNEVRYRTIMSKCNQCR